MDETHRQIQNYILQRTLGQGTFGKVKLGYHTITDEYVAIKILEKDRIQTQADLVRVQREIAILRKINHQNVIKLYEILESEQTIYLVMEYAKGGELYEYIIRKRFLPEHTAVKFFQQIIFATEYLHSQNITHRDLKPENLLLDEQRTIKVADFGLSYLASNVGENLKTACGSPCYAAPEMLVGQTYEGSKSDIWSCGIILFAMLCGYLPFEHENTKQLYELIKNSDFEKPSHLSPNALDLLTKILVKNPEKRLNFEQIKQHPFFLQITPIPKIKLNLNDQNVFQKMIEMGHSQQSIQIQLQNNKHNTITAIYFLLLKKQNQPNRKSFFQNIQNIANQQLDLNQKRNTVKLQFQNQESPNFENIQQRKRSIHSRMHNSPYLKTQTSQRFKKVNISVQQKRVSVPLDNIRQKTHSVQEKNYDISSVYTPMISDSKTRIQSRKNSKNQSHIKQPIKKDIESIIKTEINEDVVQYFKQNFPQVKTRNKTQPNNQEEKYFKNDKILMNNSQQMVQKLQMKSPYLYIDVTNKNNKQLFKQLYDVKQSFLRKKNADLFKVHKL